MKKGIRRSPTLKAPSLIDRENPLFFIVSFTLLITIFMTHSKITSVFIKLYELAKKVLGLSKLDKYVIKLSNKAFRESYWYPFS